MTRAIRLPSLEVPKAQKLGFSEADVHSSLFEPDMTLLGYPPRTSTQADGEHFVEQRTLATRRLRSHRPTGRYDGLYLLGNAPVALSEIKRYDALDGVAAWKQAKRQLKQYALSEDFLLPPPCRPRRARSAAARPARPAPRPRTPRPAAARAGSALAARHPLVAQLAQAVAKPSASTSSRTTAIPSR